MLLAMLLSLHAHSGVDVYFKNKSTLEFDLYRNVIPYVANEITVGRSGFRLEDPNGVVTINSNKITTGIKYGTGDWIRLDPHWYVQHRRDTGWTFQHGPELRIDVEF